MAGMRQDLAGRGVKAEEHPDAARSIRAGSAQARDARFDRSGSGQAEQPASQAGSDQGRWSRTTPQSYERPEEVVRWYYQSPERLREVESLVLEDNVVQWVLSRVKTEDKAADFDELMGNAKPS